MAQQTGGNLNLIKPELTDEIKQTMGTHLPDNFQEISDVVSEHIADEDVHVLEGERSAWDAKETPADAQAKANTAETNAKSYADTKVNNLAGAGRTTETVKGNADDLAAHEILEATQNELGHIKLSDLPAAGAMVEHGNEYHDPAFAKQSDLESHLSEDATHVKPARFVIGTVTAGWTAKDCHYLCDGTNDTTIINSAIQALPATGGEIILLDGIYTVQNPAQIKITLKSNVLLRGNGVGTIIQPPLNYQYAQNLIQVSGNNVSICNLAIKSNGTHSDGMRSIETSAGIRGLRIQYCYLELSIAFNQGSDFLITDNKFEACSLSPTETVTLSKIRGNSFFSAKYNGLSLTRLASSIVTGNLIQNFGEAHSGIELGIGTEDYGGNIVANNIIRQTTEGSSIGINIDGSGSKKNLVMGNHILGVKTGIRDMGSDNVIENNII